jgi:hypothetical protein
MILEIRNAVKDNCTEDAVVDNCLRLILPYIYKEKKHDKL